MRLGRRARDGCQLRHRSGVAAGGRSPAGQRRDRHQQGLHESPGAYGPGQAFNGTPPALSVSGRLWWTASNWRNRITVPLTFAPADDVCDVVGGKEGVDLYGSELMTQAMIQWRPAFCLDSRRTPFRHVQVGEPQAASLLSQSSIEAGLVSHPPDEGYGRPVVNAPVGFSGFAVTYAIDDALGAPYTTLRLTPRLLAKLLTMSYPGAELRAAGVRRAAHANPLDISLDPEFQALNPGIKKGVNNTVSASTMLSLSSDSDVVRALTTYLNADKEARAWLDGAADPWGMKVNPSYLKIKLPVQTWPQNDTFEPKEYYASGLNPCLQNSPVPYLPLIASPTIRMSNITFAMQFANSTSQVNCFEVQPGSTVGLKLYAGGRQNPGFRFVLGLTSLGDAARYALDTAALRLRAPRGTVHQRQWSKLRRAHRRRPARLRVSTHPERQDRQLGPAGDAHRERRNSQGGLPRGDGGVCRGADQRGTGGGRDGVRGVAELDGDDGSDSGHHERDAAAGLPAPDRRERPRALESYTVRAAVAVAAQKGEVPPSGAGVPDQCPQTCQQRVHGPRRSCLAGWIWWPERSRGVWCANGCRQDRPLGAEAGRQARAQSSGAQGECVRAHCHRRPERRACRGRWHSSWILVAFVMAGAIPLTHVVRRCAAAMG